MKKILIIFLIVIITFLAIYPQSKKHSTTELEISNEFITKFNINIKHYNYDSVTLDGKYRDLFIKIKILNDTNLKQSEDYILDKMFVISSMYREINSPYAGALSNKIKCDEKFKPQKIPNFPFDYYIIYASDRLIYGSCSWDLIKYKSILYYIHCNKTNNLYQIELFVPIKESISGYEEHLKSISC